MKYKALWVPLLILFSIAPVVASLPLDSETVRTIFGLLWASLFMYYLRWKNEGTPLINVLTIFLLILLEGIFLLDKSPEVAKISLIIGNMGFPISYLVRVRLKKPEEKMGRFSLLKIVGVMLFAMGNFIYFYNFPKLIEVQALGTLVLAFAYAFDRIKNYDQILERKE